MADPHTPQSLSASIKAPASPPDIRFGSLLDQRAPIPRHKFRIPWKHDKEQIRKTKELAEQALFALQKAVTLAAGISGDVGVPGLSAALSAVGEILEAIQTMSATIKGVQTLKERIEELSNILGSFCSRPRDQPLSDEMRQRLEGLASAWTKIGAKALDIKKRNWVLRFLKNKADAAELEGLVEDINTSISEFIFQGQLAIEENVHHIREVVEAVLDASFMPVYAKKAQYDSNSLRHSCLEGTRVDILKRLRQWVIASCAYTDTIAGTDPGNVQWINGLAGTGKTTIACSVSHACKELGVLGATFFCTHFDQECSDQDLIFVTISRQLCHYHAPFKQQVEAVIRREPDVVHSNPTRQCEELIVRPLEALKGVFPKAVIILDALDECSNQGATSITLTVLAKFISRIKDYLIFIVTSRPEPHIAALFDEARENSLRDTTPLLLHMEGLESVLGDIRLYLKHEFKAQVGTRKVPKGWPSSQDVDALAKMSHGLFIWAATAMRFIMQGHPPMQLRSIFDGQTATMTSDTVLNALYTQIADTAALAVPAASQGHFQSILGTVAVAKEPISTTALAELLGIHDSDLVYNLLCGVHSVLHVPDDVDDPIRVIHPTFSEFLLAPDVKKPPAFCIDALGQHCELFSRSLAVMDQLKYDICGIGDPLRLKSEVPTLDEDVKGCIPSYLRYACGHWGDHFQSAMGSFELVQIVRPFQGFLRHGFLNWLEACSLLGALDSAVTTLDTVRRVCQETGGVFSDIIPLLIDYHRFLSTYVECIDAAPLQLYQSVLAIAPSKSMVRQIYGSGIEGSPVVCHGAMLDWGPCLDVFQGNGGYEVYCVAFSPDGTHFATGGRDDKIAIRRRTTKTLLLSIGGNHGDVNAVVFSPDGSRIASGFANGIVVVWLVSSGDCVLTLNGHTNEVYSVVYSKDGMRILSNSDHEVILWDASDGRRLLTLSTLDADTWQSTLSPDGGVIAHGASSGLCMYHIASATRSILPLSGPAHASVFSPDGRYIGAASETSVSIWSVANSELVRSITLSSFPLRLAFSHDGARICCGLQDGSVCVWEVDSKDPPYIFRMHTDWVYDIAWSPDDAQIVSASGDSHVRIWDPTRRPTSDVQQEPSHTNLSSSISHPSALLCRGSGIDILRVPTTAETEQFQTPVGAPSLSRHSDVPGAWDAAFSTARRPRELNLIRCARARDWELVTGQRHIQINWRPAAISHDLSKMAYLPEGSNTEVRICNLHTGGIVAVLTGHIDDVRSAVFSSDDAFLATGSKDKTVKVWNVANATLVAGHAEHTHWIYDIALSSDNQLVVSGSSDGTVRVYSIAAVQITHILQHLDTVTKVALSADNRHVLTLDSQRNISVWNLWPAACTHRISLEDDTWPQSLDFKPDGTSILIRNGVGEIASTFAIHSAPKRTWPVYHVSKGGWVTAIWPGRARRVCWLRPEWRAVFPLGDESFCALDMDRKLSVVVNVHRTLARIEPPSIS